MEVFVGKDLPRADALAKVTGAARYTGDLQAPGMVYAGLICSSVACGRVRRIEVPMSGVLAVISHHNAPRLRSSPPFSPGGKTSGSAAYHQPPLQDDRIRYHGQPIACVVASTPEAAYDAALRARVELIEERAALDFSQAAPAESLWGKPSSQSHGQPDEALRSSEVAVDLRYDTPILHHAAMEPHATLAHWRNDGHLDVHDSTRFVAGQQRMLAEMFELPKERVRVRSTLVGGAFGGKGPTREHVPIAVMASRALKRPVLLILSRRQVFEMGGHRPQTHQRVALGADKTGALQSIIHEGTSGCSISDPFIEPFSLQTYKLYAAPNRRIAQKVAHRNESQPCPMRAPGEATGMFALESAMDELAVKLGIDPVELRLRNEPAAEPVTGKAFSSRLLRQCLERGAAEFGWKERRARVEGEWRIGAGMAAAVYPFKGNPVHARCRLEGRRALVATSTHEFGNGVTTMARQVAADALGVTPDDVDFLYGDSDLPEAPMTGGSTSTMWVGEAVRKACGAALTQAGAVPGAWQGKLAAPVEATAEAAPDKAVQERYSLDSYGAHFCEVGVHCDSGVVRVRRYLGVFDVGRVVSPRQARSQFYGAITMGIGMALLEQNHLQRGALPNVGLDTYLVPVQADIPKIEVIWLDQPDPVINALGARGVGELGIVGAPAAVANAVFHATGRRVRQLPIRPETLL